MTVVDEDNSPATREAGEHAIDGYRPLGRNAVKIKAIARPSLTEEILQTVLPNVFHYRYHQDTKVLRDALILRA